MLYLKGNILYMADRTTLCSSNDSYLAIEGSVIKGIFEEPEFHTRFCAAAGDTLIDYGSRLIIPGMVDLHLHAPQYAFRGLGMDRELLDWLEFHAFPEEMKYENEEYAKRAYQIFVDDLLQSPTTRACIYTTIHKKSALSLARLLDMSGLVSYVGKVNMDRNCPAGLREPTASSLADTEWFIRHVQEECRRTLPIITPRFALSCSEELLEGLGNLQSRYSLPVQSHLCENPDEIQMVKKMYPNACSYGDVYEHFGLFGSSAPTVMAHCIYCEEKEIARIKETGVYIAHCPNSNFSLASGIAPAQKYWKYGLNMGLGTDVAGGFSLSMFRAIQDTITVSKLYWRLVDEKLPPLGFTQAFYLATAGGGSFFGKTGTFLPGYDADILVLDDSDLKSPYKQNARERLERLCYLAGRNTVVAKYVQGRQIYPRPTQR